MNKSSSCNTNKQIITIQCGDHRNKQGHLHKDNNPALLVILIHWKCEALYIESGEGWGIWAAGRGYLWRSLDLAIKMQKEEQSLGDLWITCTGISPSSALACSHTSTCLPTTSHLQLGNQVSDTWRRAVSHHSLSTMYANGYEAIGGWLPARSLQRVEFRAYSISHLLCTLYWGGLFARASCSAVCSSCWAAKRDTGVGLWERVWTCLEMPMCVDSKTFVFNTDMKHVIVMVL